MPGSTPQRGREQRAADRFDTALPVRLDDAAGATHNVSAQGIYFETDVPQSVGALVNLTLEFRQYGQVHRVLCEGKVLRVEQQGDRIGVAARLVTPFFAGIEEA